MFNAPTAKPKYTMMLDCMVCFLMPAMQFIEDNFYDLSTAALSADRQV
jgi:hypothetical protein